MAKTNEKGGNAILRHEHLCQKTPWFSGKQSHSGLVYTGPYIESYSFGSHATKTAEVARVVCAQINALHDNVWAILFCYLKKKTQEILRIYIHCLIKTKGGGGGSHRLVNRGRDSNFGLRIISSKIKHISYLFFYKLILHKSAFDRSRQIYVRAEQCSKCFETYNRNSWFTLGAKHQIISLISCRPLRVILKS